MTNSVYNQQQMVIITKLNDFSGLIEQIEELLKATNDVKNHIGANTNLQLELQVTKLKDLV